MSNEFELSQMKTDEKNREKADRRIPINIFDVLSEILGNMDGKEIRIWCIKNELITYVSDNGFSSKDKEAICKKNCSGDNNNTVSLNGFGIRLVLDRILPDGSHCIIYSLNDKKKGAIGHFNSTLPDKWLDFNQTDEQFLSKYIKNCETGSLFKIPLNDKWYDELKEKEELIIKACNKFLSNKIADKETSFFWNDEPQFVDKICKDEGCLVIDYSLGYDTCNNELSDNHKLPVILKIKNFEHLSQTETFQIYEYNHITPKKNDKHQINHEFKSFESGILRLNICKNDDKYYKVSWIDGQQVSINKCLINLKAFTKHLGGKTDEGIFTKVDNIFGGKPRFVNEIDKNSKQYSIPVDKTNIRPTSTGEAVLRFERDLASNKFNPTKDVRENIVINLKQESKPSTIEQESKTPIIKEENKPTEEDDKTVLCANTFVEDDTENIEDDCSQNNAMPPKIFKNKDIKKETSQYVRLEPELYKDCDYYDPTVVRCLMCDCICPAGDKVAGHIQSNKCKGTINNNNLLLICTRCNGCDTMAIPERVVGRYGINHPITKRLEVYMNKTNKNIKEYFNNYRIENSTIINSIPATP